MYITAFLILFISTLSNSFSLKAQPGLGTWNKIETTIGHIIKVVYGLNILVDATKRTIDQFNSTVTVVKGTSGEGGKVKGKVFKPKIKDGKISNIDWQSVCYFDGQLFPSSIFGMSTYSGKMTPIQEAISRPLGFRLMSNTSNVEIRWEIESTDKKYFDKIGDTYIYQQANKEISLNPVIPWNYKELGKHTIAEPLNVYFRLFDEKGNKVEKLIPLTVRSINDCIFFYKEENLQFLFSTYVQEEHPAIDPILREALNTKMIDRWIGYQDSAKEVDLQVASIWRVLHDRGFVYSSITTTIGDKGDVYSQSVRTFDNALKTNQANCIDGTIVFASILRKIGLYPVLVMVPGHCFLGYYTNKSKTKLSFLETVMLSEDNYIKAAKTDKEKFIAYVKQFKAARDEGEAKYLYYNKPGKINIIDIDEARKLVQPLPVYE